MFDVAVISLFSAPCARGNEAHRDVERRMTPADSKYFNSTMAISSLSGSSRWALAKIGGVCSLECGAPSHE
jgi:hypothetical protein